MYPYILTPLLLKNNQEAFSFRGAPVTPTKDLPAGTSVGSLMLHARHGLPRFGKSWIRHSYCNAR